MSEVYRNTYKAPEADLSDLQADTPWQEYDHNFVFEVKALQSDRVRLVPFVPSLHSELLLQGHLEHPELADWLPVNFKTVDDVNRFVELTFRREPERMLYAIYTGPLGPEPTPTDPKDYIFAGAIALISSSRQDMMSELGHIQIFKRFQRTHVLTHAAGLCMRRILDSKAEGGLGLRRCQWNANSLNEPSKAAARRLGFKEDGILRNHRVLGPGKKGSYPGREGEEREECMSRDTWNASVTWQQWEQETRQHIDKLMARRQ